MIVLRPGIPAQPITGTPAVPTLSVRFQDGMAEVRDQELVDMMTRHPGFKSDFVLIDEGQGSDPFAYFRQPAEPPHAVTEIKYGTPEKRTVVGGKTTIPPELQKLIQEQAVAIAKEMLPGMVKETLQAMASVTQQSTTVDEKEDNQPSEDAPVIQDKRPRGRPPVVRV
jgi:hypothetical protein